MEDIVFVFILFCLVLFFNLVYMEISVDWLWGIVFGGKVVLDNDVFRKWLLLKEMWELYEFFMINDIVNLEWIFMLIFVCWIL